MKRYLLLNGFILPGFFQKKVHFLLRSWPRLEKRSLPESASSVRQKRFWVLEYSAEFESVFSERRSSTFRGIS